MDVPVIDPTLDLEDEIQRLRKERNAVILAHYYQESEIQHLADFIGDSLQLARAARDTDAEKRAGIGHAAVRVAEIGVARVNDQVVSVEKRAQGRDLLVDRVARGHHQDDRAGGLEGGDQIRQLLRRGDPRGKRPGPFHEGFGFRAGAVPDRDVETLFRDVESQRRPHRAQAHQSDLAIAHAVPLG